MIHFACQSCGRPFNVPDSYAGKTAKCGCGAAIAVPTHSPAPTVAPSTAPSLRQRRLAADEREMRERFQSGVVRVVRADGSPADRYELEFGVRAVVDAKGTTRDAGHRASIVLTSDYPRVGPRCRMLTPIFHPNIDAESICIGDHWSPGERLADLVLRIAEMLAMQAYNIRSPLNAQAAMWADLHSRELPVDPRDLRAL